MKDSIPENKFMFILPEDMSFCEYSMRKSTEHSLLELYGIVL